MTAISGLSDEKSIAFEVEGVTSGSLSISTILGGVFMSIAFEVEGVTSGSLSISTILGGVFIMETSSSTKISGVSSEDVHFSIDSAASTGAGVSSEKGSVSVTSSSTVSTFFVGVRLLSASD